MQDSDIIQKKKYEISYLLLNEGDFADLRRLLVQHESEISFESPIRKIAPAYSVKRAKEVYFGFTHFEAMPERAKRLEEDCRTNAKVLRSLIIDLSKEKSVTREPLRPRPMRPVPQRSAPRPEVARRPPAAISNEALEKKIEEILK